MVIAIPVFMERLIPYAKENAMSNTSKPVAGAVEELDGKLTSGIGKILRNKSMQGAGKARELAKPNGNVRKRRNAPRAQPRKSLIKSRIGLARG
jgi:uncharacterized protein YjbJ (UPF0337 family)